MCFLKSKMIFYNSSLSFSCVIQIGRLKILSLKFCGKIVVFDKKWFSSRFSVQQLQKIVLNKKIGLIFGYFL